VVQVSESILTDGLSLSQLIVVRNISEEACRKADIEVALTS